GTGDPAQGDRLADLVLALGQDGAGLAGDREGQLVEMLLEDGSGAMEDGGTFTRRQRGPRRLRQRGAGDGARHVGGVGHARAGERLAGGRLAHIAKAALRLAPAAVLEDAAGPGL